MVTKNKEKEQIINDLQEIYEILHTQFLELERKEENTIQEEKEMKRLERLENTLYEVTRGIKC